MTIILTCSTIEYIAQVSDRRLTFKDGKPPNDNANKAIAFKYDNVFAYTGIAKIGTKRTDLWIADILEQHFTLEEALQAIQCKANKDIQRLPYSEKRLAVICACFASTEPYAPHMPTIVVISNFYDENGNCSSKAKSTFSRINLTFNPSVPFVFHEAGQLTTVTIRKLLFRNINRAITKSM